MSLLRRFLLICALLDGGDDTNLVLKFLDGIVTLNYEGNGTKVSVIGTEVTLSE